jgi:hypothetical protein
MKAVDRATSTALVIFIGLPDRWKRNFLNYPLTAYWTCTLSSPAM